jgi:crotonobetainyl-CoA:carnitine CoA-transferase CaiB-like acyl-CoA transferase
VTGNQPSSTVASDDQGPLSGIRVVELCHLIAGPFVGMMLADEGAEVIKVEAPKGDLTRTREPIRTTDQGTMSGYFASLNRRKKSVVLDLKSDAGVGVFHELLASADVLITNMRPKALGRLGIHPYTLSQRYPSLVVTSMTGFGLERSDPDADRAGLAMVAEGLSGTTSLTRDRTGMPVWCGFALGDIVSGMIAQNAILLALRERDRTGTGRLLDFSLIESTLPLVSVAMARVQAVAADATAAQVQGANDFHGVPYGTFAAADGHYNVGVNRDDFWVRLAGAMGRPELGHDPRYATYLERAQGQAEVEEALESWSRELPRDQVIKVITAADVPVAPVLTMSEVLELEYFRARGSLVEVDDAIGGTYRQPTDPTGFAISSPARVPHLGEHRDDVLGALGMDDAAICALAGEGAFGPGRT